MIIEIDALDTLFFRDSKPFSMGEETWADGIFPPHPSTIYGALRSLYFANNISELQKANEGDDPTQNLKIKGFYLKIGYDLYFPLPLDCVKEKNSKKDEVFILNLNKKGDFTGNFDFKYYLISENKVENVVDGLLRISAFEKYLSSSKGEFAIQKMSDFTTLEPKIGIARSNDTLTSSEGKLYRVGMKRLANKKGVTLKIIVDFEGLDIPEKGILKLGAEGKSARYKTVDENLKVELPVFKEEEKYFKVVLSTPAIFKNGWVPEWIDEESLEGEIHGVKVKLISAAVGRPIILGGFDMKRGRPKPAYKAVPVGSVYYFELLDGDINKVIDFFHQNTISDVYNDEGFGISFIGKFEL